MDVKLNGLEDNIVKMSILLKAIHRFSATLIKTPTIFFAEIEKPILKFMWKLKGLHIAKIMLKTKQNQGTLIS